MMMVRRLLVFPEGNLMLKKKTPKYVKVTVLNKAFTNTWYLS